jgi:hypothetical protein
VICPEPAAFFLRNIGPVTLSPSETFTMIEQPSRPGPGQQRQIEIYQLGLAGKTPTTPVSVEALEQQARKQLKTEAFDYLAGGAGAEGTLRANT